jgi:transposase
MPGPLSNDLRERIVLAVAGGMSRNAAAKKYDVAISSVVKLMQRWQATKCWEPEAMGGYRGHKLTPYQEDVLTILKEKTDITLKEFAARLKDRKIKISPSSVDRFLNHLGQGYKKNGSRQRARQARRKGGAGRMEEKSGNA